MDYAIENNQQIIVKLLFNDLKEKYSSMQNEIQQLRIQKESSEREISSQEEDIWKLKCKNRLSEREVTSREGQIRQLKDDNIILKGKIASQQEEIQKLKNENRASKGEISSREGQIKLLKEDNRMSNRKIASQQEEIQRLREENRLSKVKFASQQKEIKQLKNENKISKGRITPQLEEIIPPKSENKILKGKNTSQQEEIQRLEEENKEMTEKTETYKMYLTSLTEKPSDLHFFDINEYEEESVIGEGSTSRVKIVHKKEKYAMKELLLFDHKSMQRFLGECEILFNLRHPCIIRVYGFNIGDDTHKPSIILSLEPKSLDSAIRSKELDEEQRNRITVELVLGMRYIHKFKIMHRDLKPLNILLSKNNHVRIADFGLATEENFEVTQTKGVGTLLFMAPELFDDENENRYTNKVDVYSFGVVLIFIVTEKYPSNSIITGVFPKLPKEMPKWVLGLITNCLSRNPENRPSFADIFEIMKANNFDFFSDSKDKELTKNQQYMKKRIEARITKIEAFEFQHQ